MSTTVPEEVGSYDELNLDVIRRPTRTLRIRGHAYPVASTLTIPMMGMLLDLEQGIREASIEPDDPGPDASEYEQRGFQAAVAANRKAAVDAMNSAHDAIVEMLQVESPGASLQFDTAEVLAIIQWLVRSPGGATGAVVSAITDAGGAAAEPKPGEPATATPPGDPDEGGAPLESVKPSSRRSSGTGGKPSSRRAGGPKSSGTTSGSPAASRAAA